MQTEGKVAVKFARTLLEIEPGISRVGMQYLNQLYFS
jgi:hypothetical protein